VRIVLAGLLALSIPLAGCGRRAERSFFDAKPLPAPSAATDIAKPLGKTALHVEWAATAAPREAVAGGTIPLVVTFTNRGDAVWPDDGTASPGRPDGRYAVRLSYSWRAASETEARRSADRADLKGPVAPGGSATLPIAVRVPETPGAYELKIELLQELYFWFADYGEPTLTLPVEVRPASATRQ